VAKGDVKGFAGGAYLKIQSENCRKNWFDYFYTLQKYYILSTILERFFEKS